MDSIMKDLLLNPEEWPSNSDDFMNLFPLDTNLLFNDSSSGSPCEADSMNDITSSLINNLQSGFNYGDVCGPTDSIPIEPALMSPISSLGSDQEFHGFPNSSGTSLDGSGYEDNFIAGPSMAPESSSSSSSSSSSIKMELDEATINEFYTFERNVQQQALSSAASDSGLSSDHLEFDPAGDYEALSPALSSPGPSVSERGGQNSPPRIVKQTIPVSQIIVQPQPQNRKTLATVPTITATPAVTVPKAGKVYHTVKTVLTAGNNNNKELPQPQGTPHLANGKEVKIYRVASVKNGQTVNVANGTNANKKVTLQLKNETATTTPGKTNGTVFINNKNVVLTPSYGKGSSGIRKIFRVQQQQQQNGRSILVPVSIQDLRTIKIVNSAKLKTDSADLANIKLAAANLLQQSKHGLIQKNVVLTKEQLMVDDSDTTQNSDNESFVFEDIMQQSNTVIEQVERHHQKQRQQQPIVSESDDELDDDLDGDDSMCGVGNGKNAAGGYQKLVLTAEEKRLLEKEGISLPTSYPLTKHEERELKRIRRKIRNKISAQDSRKRKKEYVDGLEERVKQCTEENQTLLKRIKILQSQNHDLMSQMKKIQSLLTKGTGKTTQPATCLMVLLLSMALVAVPNLNLGGTHQQQNIQDSIEMAELLQDAAQEKTQVQTQVQNRRSLLFDTKEQLGDALVDEEMNFDELMSFNVNSLIASEHDYTTEEEPPKAKKAKMSSLVEYDVDDDIWNGSSKMRIKMEIEEQQNKLFSSKDKQFAEAFDQSTRFNIKNEHSEVIVDRDLLESMSKKGIADLYNGVNLDQLEGSTGSLSKHGHNIELLGTGIAATAGGVEEVSRKLNASQQIQQQNSKRKLLL